MKYYGPICPKNYVVLSKGFRPFETDSLREAEEDAAFKKDYSSLVSVINIDDELVTKYVNHMLVYHRP